MVDCIEMTEEYIDKVKNENHLEYILGEYKVGRYAWGLENVEVLDQLISTKNWEYGHMKKYLIDKFQVLLLCLSSRNEGV